MATTQYESLWIATAPPPAYPSLTGDIRTGIAVVGGGMVGVLTAALLARAGHDVALIEARRVLGGVTGYTTAKVSASHGPIYSHLRKEFGPDEAALYALINLQAIDWIEANSRNADFRRRDLCLYGESSETVQSLDEEAEAANAAGFRCERVATTELPFETHGAVRFPNQAEFHPLKFLAPFLADLEGKIYEGTAVQEVEEGEPTVLVTREGRRIVADQVVLATHFPFFDPAFYYARLNPFRDYAIAVEVEGPLPEAMYVGSGEGYTYRRQPVDGGELLIVSGGNHKVGKVNDTEAFYRKIEEHTRRHFSVQNIPYRWATQDNSTIDKVPYVGRISARSERVFVACGFGGWGMTNSVASAELIVDLIHGRNNPLADLYSPLRFKPVTGASTLIEIGKDSVQHLIGERLHHAKRKTPADMEPGEADVIETPDGKVAVFKDRRGTVHAVSPVCTHMGCILKWNNAESSWDCPCHGSRFDHQGTVLHGPAVRNLAPVVLDPTGFSKDA